MEKKCPDYEIVEWNESNYDYKKNQYMYEAYQEKKWGFVPDYARLDIIYNYGGFYLDTDVELLKSLDVLIDEKSYIGFESSNSDDYFINFGQGFGAERHSEILKRIRDSYENKKFRNEDGSLNLIPSPILNTEILLEMGLKQNNTFQKIGDLSIYPAEFLCPKSFNTGKINKTKNTISIHHFAASWYTEEQKLAHKKRLKEQKIDRIKHLPNRTLKSLLGASNYEKLKENIRKLKI